MSGYNPKTGVFELTATKARFWFRRQDVPERFVKVCDCCGTVLSTEWDVLKSVIEWQGLQIIKDGGNYLHVKATAGELWEALSGQPSDPEIAKRHTRFSDSQDES